MNNRLLISQNEVDAIRTQLRYINKQLAELRSYMEVHDIVNRKEALKITGVTPGTFSAYVCQGKYVVISRNRAGQAFFSRRQLLGLD